MDQGLFSQRTYNIIIIIIIPQIIVSEIYFKGIFMKS